MPTILGLALKISADATGVQQKLTPVERALNQLDEQAKQSASVFAEFAKTTAAAAEAQGRVGEDIASLTEKLRSGQITAQEFAAAFATVQANAAELGRTFAEGARLTESLRTAEERRALELERIDGLLRAGAITEDIAARAKAQASGANAASAKAEQVRAAAVADASRIIRANLTPQERYDMTVQELTTHLREGRLTQEQFNRAVANAREGLNSTAKAASDTDRNIDRLNRNVNLLKNLQIGRAIVDGLQLLGNTFTSVTNQIGSLVGSVNSSLDQLNDFSARTGIGVEALQGYTLAAKLAGVDTEQFGVAVQKLAVTIGKATPGGELDKSLKNINLSVRELRALSPEGQFQAIGNAISQLPTAAERAAAAVQIFGKQGAALAPLFREGAAGIEELKARAERLGIIVNETQINNVASMNDAFDLVSATIQGIIGQVIGNLAPAVTNVTEELLKFVETFAGAQGTGGTGIANAITETLFNGGEYLASVFDSFVANFDGFAVGIATSADVFSAVANTFTAVTESLRAVFNFFEVTGNLLLVGLGKFLDGLGSYVSSDLQKLGQQIQVDANAAAQKNAREAEAAAANAAAAFGRVFSGETAAAAGDGAAVKAIQAARERFTREQAPEFKVSANLDKAAASLENYLKQAGDGADEFLKKSQETLEVFKAQAAEGNLLPEQIKVMNGFVDQLNQKLNQELELRQQAREETMKQAEEDQKRIDELLKKSNAVNQLQQDADAVARESQRVQEQLAAARQEGLTAEANAAAARLAQLDQLGAKLEEQLQAEAQGFSDGFGKAFDATTKGIDSLIAKAEQFGTVGDLAAQALQQGIQQAQDQAKDGILTREAYDAEVGRQQQLFNERLAAAQRVEDYLMSRLDDRQRAELEATQKLEERKKQAATNVQAIEAKIIDQQKALEEARSSGRLKDAKAAQSRINDLKAVQRSEQAIADGRQQAERIQTQQITANSQRQQQFQGLVARQNETFLNSFTSTFAGANNALAQANAVAERQAAKIEQLLTPGPRTVQGADVRTAEGAALVVGLAVSEQDPALIEARLQNKALKAIQQAIVSATTQYINTPVAIL